MPYRTTTSSITQPSVLDDLLSAARPSCATIFFTSSTCAPCKIAYPAYDSLAAQHPRATFIEVDINQAHDIGARYQIRATPTFMTFLRGAKVDEWSGASPAELTGKVNLLVQQAFPAHPHAALRVPALTAGSLRPVTFSRIPPLDKVLAKMGAEASTNPAVLDVKTFLQARQSAGAREAPLPDLPRFAAFLRNAPERMSRDALFTAYDLLRCAVLDARVAAWFAEEGVGSETQTQNEGSRTLLALFRHVAHLITSDECPYSLRLVAIQLATNLFATPLAARALVPSAPTSSPSELGMLTAQVAAGSLLAERQRVAVRSAAASLAFDVAAANYRVRREEGREGVSEAVQVELVAALLELVGEEVGQGQKDDVANGNLKNGASGSGSGNGGSAEALHAALLALGYLVYYAPVDGEVWDLCIAMDARTTIGLVKDGLAGKVAKDLVQCLPEST